MKKVINVLSISIICFLFSVPAYVSAGQGRFCSAYARKAVDQYNTARQNRLPGIVPPVWSDREKDHYNWCLMVPENVANNETRKRQAYLDHYLSKNGSKNRGGSGQKDVEMMRPKGRHPGSLSPQAIPAVRQNPAIGKSFALKMTITSIFPSPTPPDRIIKISGKRFGVQSSECKAYLVQFNGIHPKNYPMKIRHWTDSVITASIPKHVPAGLYLVELAGPGRSLPKNSGKTLQITGKPKITALHYPPKIYLHTFPKGSGLHFQYYDFPLTVLWEDANRDLVNGQYQLIYRSNISNNKQSNGWQSLKALNLKNSFAGPKGKTVMPLKLYFGPETKEIKFSLQLKDESGNLSNTRSGAVYTSPKNRTGKKSPILGAKKIKKTTRKIKKILILTQDSDPHATFADVPYSASIPWIKGGKLKSVKNKSQYTMSFDTGFSSKVMAAKCSSDPNVTTEFILFPGQTHNYSSTSLDHGIFFHICADPASKKESSLKLEYVYEVTR